MSRSFIERWRTAGGSEQALPLLAESRQRFEAVEQRRPGCGAAGMTSVCFTAQGDCLLCLGRLDDAAAAYEEAIDRAEKHGHARQVAVGKGQLGTVRMLQRRYPEALAAFAAAREQFTQLDEPGSVAVIWHQTGMAYQNAGQPEAAAFYRQAADRHVAIGDASNEGRDRSNLAITLRQLGRLKEARQEIRRAIDCDAPFGHASEHS